MNNYYRQVEKVFGEKGMTDLMEETIEALNNIRIKENYNPP